MGSSYWKSTFNSCRFSNATLNELMSYPLNFSCQGWRDSTVVLRFATFLFNEPKEQNFRGNSTCKRAFNFLLFKKSGLCTELVALASFSSFNMHSFESELKTCSLPHLFFFSGGKETS